MFKNSIVLLSLSPSNLFLLVVVVSVLSLSLSLELTTSVKESTCLKSRRDSISHPVEERRLMGRSSRD